MISSRRGLARARMTSAWISNMASMQPCFDVCADAHQCRCARSGYAEPPVACTPSVSLPRLAGLSSRGLRLGLLYAQDGMVDGRSVRPAGIVVVRFGERYGEVDSMALAANVVSDVRLTVG